MIQGSASQYAGRGKLAQAGWAYLNPAIASSAALFAEIDRDTGNFTTSSSSPAGSSRRCRSAATPQRLGVEPGDDHRGARGAADRIGQSIQRLPGFMRLANRTFANVHDALDVLTPLVNATKPVAPKLQSC